MKGELCADGISRQTERPVYHYLLAERSRHHIERPTKGRKQPPVDLAADRAQPMILANL